MPETALITGAAGGIGRVLATRLAGRGYEIIAVDRSEAAVTEALAGVPGVVPVGCDLADRAETNHLAERIFGDWSGTLELLICNAGVVIPGDVAEASPDDVTAQLDVMLVNVTRLIGAGAAAFKARGRGHILATVSMGGIIALPGSAAYSAAKAGLRAYLWALSNELRGTGVAVSGIYPSAVDTAMLRHEAAHGGSPLNFFGTISTASDVADAYDKALASRRLETYLPYSDSVLSRVAQSLPWIVPPLLPVLNRLGEKGRERYLARSSACTESSPEAPERSKRIRPERPS